MATTIDALHDMINALEEDSRRILRQLENCRDHEYDRLQNEYDAIWEEIHYCWKAIDKLLPVKKDSSDDIPF